MVASLSLQGKANLLMVIVTMFWGLSYTFMVMGLDVLEAYNVVALRCLIAFIIAGLIFLPKMLRINKKRLYTHPYKVFCYSRSLHFHYLG